MFHQAAIDRFSTFTISLLLALTVNGSVIAVGESPRPNLLFILTDEQRHDTLRAYGNDAIQTPHLDRLADEGVVFRRAYVSQPVCSPARSTILTGLWPHQSGVTANNIPLRKETRTLPELVDDPLYRSAFMGKWHLGSELQAQHGFDEWVSIEDGYTLEAPEKSTYHHWLIERGHIPDTRHGTFSREFSNRLALEHSKTTFLEQRASAFLERNRERPFILYVSFLHPHTPNFGPLDSLHNPDDVQLAPTLNAPLGDDAPLRYRWMRASREVLTRARWKEEIARYWGLVAQVDRSVGAILEKLKELDLQERTIVAFTSEHGKQMGEHGLSYKGVMYEASTRVPWLIRAPGIAHSVVETAVSHIDLVPTLLELLGRPAVPSLPGRSLVPLMKGEATRARDVFLQWHPHQRRRVPGGIATVSGEEIERALEEATRTVVTQDGWKLSLRDVDRAQLFHLETDPHEARNLFATGKHQREIDTLSRRLSAWQKSVGDPLVLPGTRRRVSASRGMLEVVERIDRLESRFDTQLHGWRAHVGDIPRAEAIDLDDSTWEEVDIGYRWETPYSICWFRRWIEVPERVGGVSVRGARLLLRLAMDNGGAIHVNGELAQAEFERSGGRAVLTESARPGERYHVAVRGVNRPGWGSLLDARLESGAALEILPPTLALLEKLRFAGTIIQTEPLIGDWTGGLLAALDTLDIDSLDRGHTAKYLATLAPAGEVFQERAVAVLRRRTERRVGALEGEVAALSETIRRGETGGLDLSYQRVTSTVAKNFLKFSRNDLEADDVRIVTRGMWNVDWLAGATSRALAEARRILDDPSRQRPVPRYVTGPTEIRQGAFWQHQRPLFFVGVGHFGQVRRDIPIFPDYGFNIAQITISVGSVLPAEDEVNMAPIDELVSVLDRAARSHVAVDVLIEPHGWPRWASETYPELVSANRGFLKYKIDHPRAGAILEKYLNVLIPRIAGHPALFSYCLFNEPFYMDASEFSLERFRAWLATRHGDIETLNRRHKSDYTTFDDVPLPAGILEISSRGERPTLEVERAIATGTARLYDWYRFNQDRFGEVHEWVVETIHRLDPDTPVHSKVMGKLFDTQHEFASGVDHEKWCTATDISGNDNWSYYRSWTDHDSAITGEYASNWWRQAMYYDFQRSVAPRQPVFNSENHPIEDDHPIWVSGRHIRTLYWQGAIHGQGATTTWVWERGDGPSLGDCIITRSNCTHALGTVGLDLLRLGREVVTLQQIQPEVALLVVRAAIPFSGDYLDAMKRAFEGLCFLGAPLGFVTERQTGSGELAKYGAIIVPEAARVPDELVDQIDAYVDRGGTLIVTGESFSRDEYGHSRERPSFLPPAAGPEVPCRRSHGRGTVVCRPAPMSPKDWQLLGEALMADLGVRRPIRVSDEKGGVVNGVEYRSAPFRGGYLLNVVSYRRHEVPVRIVAPRRIERLTNLFDGESSESFLELAPLEPLLLFIETTGEPTGTK